MIPISLLVTVEIVKYAQGFFISYDKLMAQKRIINKREETIRAKVWRSSINEELGMVKYVLTDKTGTLTKNEMKLKKLVIGNALYHNDNENSGNGKNLNSQNYYTNEKLQK
jgi:magnesium-transporting ATPase (P-type)